MTNIKCTKESDRNHSALRTSKQYEQNKMTDVIHFNVTIFYIIFAVVFLEKSSLLSTRNVGHFVLFMLFTCSLCTGFYHFL